ncbi:hypothetical protein IWX90DRAFT_59217 [Phyllosticta citrichinensis]|uniref:Uncharacterized protein n=1 Tax=Phyllosticta citrichinensis TaxID=1130410 RepID=A0ABR1XGZ0_9PEZI
MVLIETPNRQDFKWILKQCLIHYLKRRKISKDTTATFLCLFGLEETPTNITSPRLNDFFHASWKRTYPWKVKKLSLGEYFRLIPRIDGLPLHAHSVKGQIELECALKQETCVLSTTHTTLAVHFQGLCRFPDPMEIEHSTKQSPLNFHLPSKVSGYFRSTMQCLASSLADPTRQAIDIHGPPQLFKECLARIMVVDEREVLDHIELGLREIHRFMTNPAWLRSLMSQWQWLMFFWRAHFQSSHELKQQLT